MTYLFPILLVAMGVYVLYGAIKGSGRLFTMENIKEEAKEKVFKLLRILYFALAAVMILMAVVNFSQTVLYSQQVTYFEATPKYSEDFSDIIQDGTIEYQGIVYEVAGQHTRDEMSAILMRANEAHPEAFKSESSSSMFNCFGGSTTDPSADYYKVIEITDAKGNKVYESTIGAVRSDANDGSFLSKLYGAIPDVLLRVLSYVFMGLAIVGIVSLFVIIRKFTDKEKEAKARSVTRGTSMPSSAFDFDDEDKKE